MRQPLAVRNPDAARLPRTYVACTENRDIPFFTAFAARARAEDWDYRELPTGYVPMQTTPRELADLLLDLA